MIHSSHRDRKTKAIAEALAMLDGVHLNSTSHRPRPVREIDEQLWESATEFAPRWTAMQGALWKLREHSRRPPGARARSAELPQF